MKNGWSVLTALVLATVMMAVVSANAFADELHTHALCGRKTGACAHSDEHEAISYAEWDGVSLNLSSGVYNYVLTQDVMTPIRIPAGVTLNLCLNGHTLSGSETTISVVGGILNLCDCKGNGKLTSANNSYQHYNALEIGGGCANLYDVHIDDCVNNGAVIITEGSLNMIGGSLSNNRCHHDGGVLYLSDSNTGDDIHPSACFSGVTISNNDNSYDDGYGTIRMDGGSLTIENSTISGNKSTRRGAIALYYDAVSYTHLRAHET